jgi:hypothetical protein
MPGPGSLDANLLLRFGAMEQGYSDMRKEVDHMRKDIESLQSEVRDGMGRVLQSLNEIKDEKRVITKMLNEQQGHINMHSKAIKRVREPDDAISSPATSPYIGPRLRGWIEKGVGTLIVALVVLIGGSILTWVAKVILDGNL